MDQKTKDLIALKTGEYIAQLNNRYQAHVSNCFLGNLLIDLMLEYLERYPIERRLSEVAYKSSVKIFEGLLEYSCKAGGNGHHVAQDYSAMFLDEPKPAA